LEILASAMSQENVDKLGVIFDLVFGGRPLGPDLLADDAEWVNPPDAVEPGTRSGAAAFNDAIATVFATWDDVRFDTDRVIGDGDRVVALGVLHGHMHASGMEIDSPHGQIWTFRDGRVTRMQWFNSRADTMRAAGE
jgi:ketosteroid isomerase-like protein